jgi:hypothetical protein
LANVSEPAELGDSFASWDEGSEFGDSRVNEAIPSTKFAPFKRHDQDVNNAQATCRGFQMGCTLA